jgi:hypothetical protein
MMSSWLKLLCLLCFLLNDELLGQDQNYSGLRLQFPTNCVEADGTKKYHDRFCVKVLPDKTFGWNWDFS